MENMIKKLIAGENENHILPFFWMREQTEEVLRTEIEKIDNCGIKAICIESRPHPDFGGETWWRDIDIIMDECKKRGMNIWILDDAHFPTGQANDMIPNKYPERSRKYAMCQYLDTVGPIKYANVDVELMMTKKFTWMDFGKHIEKPIVDKNELISVIAVKIAGGDVIEGTAVDITEYVKDGMLTWDVPAGSWRICINFTTYDFGSNNNYINYIDKESVSTLIEAVYEPHFERYKEEFGKTILGFFSDEPGFYNVAGYVPGNALWNKEQPLPWCDEMQQMISEGDPDWKKNITYIWLTDADDKLSPVMRRKYMDNVSKLYSKNFSRQLGEWCDAHGVEYIGHVIEDFDEHSRLGMGTGHYFRAMEGQHMGGIDVIGDQIVPGKPHAARHGVTCISPGEFYHYELCKLGASAAQIDPKKKGRLMCEAYGAYGWNFGTKGQKWLTDFLLVNGVNHLVPHAFSMADYPDIDCPPHFHARGNNPQYPYFAELMKYANRMCELLNGGKNVPQAAVLYPGEHDWTHECMKLRAVGEVLCNALIDYEVLPMDVFENKEYYGTSMKDGKLIVNERVMKVLVIPEAKQIDARLIPILEEAVKNAVPVIFVNSYPEKVIGADICAEVIKAYGKAVSLCELKDELTAIGAQDVITVKEHKDLIAYHYRKNSDIYMFFNTELGYTVEDKAVLPVEGEVYVYDVMNNKAYRPGQKKTEGGVEIQLSIAPYESVVYVVPAEPFETEVSAEEKWVPSGGKDISKGWKVSKVRAIDYPEFTAAEEVDELRPVSEKDMWFSGVIRYEKTVDIPGKGKTVFDPEFVYEAAEVFVNGISAGKKFIPPYEWDITELVKDGENTISVEVANTPARDAYHAPSPFGPERAVMEPSGMFGKISLLW